MMILTALLGIGFIFALAGDFVLLAKLDEQRKATAEEYNRRWDEISRAVGLENEIEQLKKQCETINDIALSHFARGINLYEKNAKMQDKLSALLCPTSNHIWKDGRCVKCGRTKDA